MNGRFYSSFPLNFLFIVSLLAGKSTYTLKDPSGNVMIRVFRIIGVRWRNVADGSISTIGDKIS